MYISFLTLPLSWMGASQQCTQDSYKGVQQPNPCGVGFFGGTASPVSTSYIGVWGSAVSSHSRGPWQSPGKKRIWCILGITEHFRIIPYFHAKLIFAKANLAEVSEVYSSGPPRGAGSPGLPSADYGAS